MQYEVFSYIGTTLISSCWNRFSCLPAAFSQKKQDERRESTDKVLRGAWEAEDETWWERRFKQMWGVLKSKEKEQLDAGRRQPSAQHSNCKYCIKLWRHMTRADNWIIKACLTKAWAPPPIWKGMSKVCDLLHLCALIPPVGVGLPPESASPSAVISSFHLQEGQFFLSILSGFVAARTPPWNGAAQLLQG